MLTYFLRMDTKDKWDWTVVETHGPDDTSGRTIARSTDIYPTRDACEKDVMLIKKLSADAIIMDFIDKGAV